MARPETIRFEFRRFCTTRRFYENDLVAKLPGLIITQFALPESTSPAFPGDELALRFDFTDDWYSILAFLDNESRPTGHYKITMQTPLRNEDGIWKGDDLILRLEIMPDFHYTVTGEDNFVRAVEEGCMKVYSAVKAREALHALCHMVDSGSLPQEVMDAVHG